MTMPHVKNICLCMALPAMASSCALRSQPAFDEHAAPEQFRTVAIADLQDALTFARISRGGQPRVIAVRRYEDGIVHGVDLSALLRHAVADPIALYVEHGYKALQDLIEHAPRGAAVSVRSNELVLPVDLSGHHIAAGTNFPAHAGETRVEGGPFLFPKLVQPTGPYDEVSARGDLLDYEVELAWVPLRPITQGRHPKDVGLILCNDYSDRAVLLRNVDVHNVASGKGFTTGKSFPGFLPVGNLFVIPRDHRDFAKDLALRLYVNHALRQRAMVREMIWDLGCIVDETWKRRSTRWEHHGQQVSLLGDSHGIRDRVLVMSGTPHGVVFRGIPTTQRLAGFLAWLAGGWGRSIPAHVIDVYIRDATSARIYLQPGDRVVIHVDRLGVIDNVITH